MSDAKSQVSAGIIIIGNEILSGRTHDKNTHFLAGRLTEMGINVGEAIVVPDIPAKIIETVQTYSKRFDYVFTTGGIGPTHDDLTSESVAKAFNTPLELNADAHEILKNHYKHELNEARLKMGYIPVGAELIENPVSAAPGFRIENVYVMAGIPSIMQAMFASIKHQLKGGAPLLSKTISGPTSEGLIATELTQIQKNHPEVDIGSYPFFHDGVLGVSLVIRGTDQAKIDAAAVQVEALVEKTKR